MYIDIDNVNAQIKKLRDAAAKYRDALQILKRRREQIPTEWPGDTGKLFYSKWNGIIDMVNRRLEKVEMAIEELERERDRAQEKDGFLSDMIVSTISGRKG